MSNNNLIDEEVDDLEIVCTLCTEKIINAKFARCDSCGKSNHYNCAKITPTEQRSLELRSNRRLKFFCNDCTNGMSALPQILSTISVLQDEIKLLRQSISECKHRDITSVDQQPQDFDIEQVIEEIADRQMKRRNIIFHGVMESEKLNVAERQAEDVQNVTKTLSLFDDNCPNIIMTARLGKKNSNKPRPLRVVLDDPRTVTSILKRKNLYKGPIGFSSDKTLQQRKHMLSLKNELERLNSIEGGQQKTIKYIKGCPKIVDIDLSKSLNSKNPSTSPTKSGSTTKM
ncbi:hypothetical protein R5R35_011740 [Gryllus longicercus]|uniref:PHD-type domain-containing protein n=1 Tax=Gryllus longicercus TaxID=2509291 RepID=A0AAN9V396_9ORTH